MEDSTPTVDQTGEDDTASEDEAVSDTKEPSDTDESWVRRLTALADCLYHLGPQTVAGLAAFIDTLASVKRTMQRARDCDMFVCHAGKRNQAQVWSAAPTHLPRQSLEKARVTFQTSVLNGDVSNQAILEVYSLCGALTDQELAFRIDCSRDHARTHRSRLVREGSLILDKTRDAYRLAVKARTEAPNRTDAETLQLARALVESMKLLTSNGGRCKSMQTMHREYDTLHNGASEVERLLTSLLHES